MYRAHSFKTVSMPFSYVVVCGDTLTPLSLRPVGLWGRPSLPTFSAPSAPSTHGPLSMGC